MDIIPIDELKALDKTQSEIIQSNFTKFFDQAREWEQKARELVVTDESQKDKIKQAKEARLALKGIRCDVENRRKELKEESLRVGKAIDNIANVLKALIVPIEEHLEKQEKFIENLEKARKEKLRIEREEKLSPYLKDVHLYNLGDMSEAGFNELFSGSKTAHDARVEGEKRAEEERIAREKANAEEQARIRLENEILKKEADEKEALLQKERDERMRLEAEKVERERVENERLEIEAEKKRQEEVAPDKEKLIKFVEQISALEVPVLKTKKAKLIISQVEDALSNLIDITNTKIKTL